MYLSNGVTPQEWLKFHYSIEIGDSISTKSGRNVEVKNIKETDNIGHFRTTYPVVIGIHNPELEFKFSDSVEWITIESIYGY